MNEEPLLPRVTTRHDVTARIGLGVGVPMLLIVLAYVPFLLVQSELGDRVASHFDSSGTPDGSMSVTALLLVTSALITVGAGLCIGTAIRRPTTGSLAATAAFSGGFVGALGAAMLASTAVTQRGLDDWRDAGGVGWTLLFGIVGSTAVGALSAWLTMHINSRNVAAPSVVDVPILDLAPGESAVWLASLRSRLMLLLGVVAAAGGLALLALSSWIGGAALLCASIPLTALSTLNVRVDRTGLRIKYGWLPRPTTHIEVADIETAQVIDVRPSEWGGLGYRGSLKLMRRAAVVHRAGPGIRLDLTNGNVFVVTIDDAETGVALLNALIQRRAEVSQPLR